MFVFLDLGYLEAGCIDSFVVVIVTFLLTMSLLSASLVNREILNVCRDFMTSILDVATGNAINMMLIASPKVEAISECAQG